MCQDQLQGLAKSAFIWVNTHPGSMAILVGITTGLLFLVYAYVIERSYRKYR